MDVLKYYAGNTTYNEHCPRTTRNDQRGLTGLGFRPTVTENLIISRTANVNASRSTEKPTNQYIISDFIDLGRSPSTPRANLFTYAAEPSRSQPSSWAWSLSCWPRRRGTTT